MEDYHHCFGWSPNYHSLAALFTVITALRAKGHSALLGGQLTVLRHGDQKHGVVVCIASTLTRSANAFGEQRIVEQTGIFEITMAHSFKLGQDPAFASSFLVLNASKNMAVVIGFMPGCANEFA